MRRGFIALVTLAAAVVTLTAQQPIPPQNPPQNPQPPVFKAGTNQVRVDATVLDRKGNPVTNLTKDDFVVTEDGIPQTVATLKLIEATGAAPDDDMSLEIRSPEHAAVEAARDDIRVFVIFWDEYHIAQMAASIRARETLTDFVQNAFGPTDLVALMDQLTPTDAIRFTRDRRALADDVHTLKGRLGVYVPARSPMEEAQMSHMSDIEMLRAQVTATALESTIAFLGSIKEGRKSIVFVSQTIGRLGDSPNDTTDWLDETIRRANANNVTIYSLDPRGLDMNARPSETLLSLAEQTGGRQFSNNYPASEMRQIVKNASAFYLLGYASVKNPTDGKFHRIGVKVKRPGVEVKARTGYYAPSLVEMDTARKAAAVSEVPPEITKALEHLVDAPHLPVAGDLWAGATRGPTGAPRIILAWNARDGATAAASVEVRATGSDRRVYFNGPLAAGKATFDAPPGTLNVRRTLVGPDGAPLDSQDQTIEVPDFAGAPLSMSSAQVFRARTPLELRAIQADPNAPPFAGRQFERTDRLLLRFALFGPSAADATVTATLLSRRGTTLATLPFKAGPGGTYEVDLPMGSVGRGEYVIAIDASHGADKTRQLVPFQVGEPQ